MKTDLDHLPERKRRELEQVVKILFEEFEDALAGRNAPHRKAGRILKVILFGSYARGDWVEDPVGGYFSDFDLLVVVNHDELADVAEYWTAAEDHLVREYVTTKRLKTQVGFIVHSLTDVNRQLKHGRYFFTDIVRDGIALYEAPDHPFAQPEPLSEAAAVEEARGYFDKWFPSAEGFLDTSRYATGKGRLNEAAFLLHQATERFYHCLLLVRTLYSPKSHKLNFLRDLCEELEPRVIAAWPRDTKFAQRCFELLRRAYVDARYSPHYKITAEELAWLIERVTILQDLVRTACDERLRGEPT
ncbi:putative nucleotidyltransferase/HEPN domain-containing protein [Sphingomonas kyeonggiensis]|uniref:Putative nucleotidyltransferase/HEPN domain-containing protein n=1 Tax=Sphingomonas kyeonggiensis TaxID=1268553 RepID=A0A7W7K6I0_9SPHN|nr:HEPN domain-containing protein [Sphingomonas kyeonggiensis]MBB4841320.1 putative nucleotidyltransferase/HEPN domain-containing protein [Sphingomonas kyeonggiensis]